MRKGYNTMVNLLHLDGIHCLHPCISMQIWTYWVGNVSREMANINKLLNMADGYRHQRLENEISNFQAVMWTVTEHNCSHRWKTAAAFTWNYVEQRSPQAVKDREASEAASQRRNTDLWTFPASLQSPLYFVRVLVMCNVLQLDLTIVFTEVLLCGIARALFFLYTTASKVV